MALGTIIRYSNKSESKVLLKSNFKVSILKVMHEFLEFEKCYVFVIDLEEITLDYRIS